MRKNGHDHLALGDVGDELRLPRFNIGPGQTCAIARAGDDGSMVTAATWGLRLGGRFVINLRSETTGRHPGLERCVIPVDGFYEWVRHEAQEVPMT